MHSQQIQDPPFDPALNSARQMLVRFAALSFVDPAAGSWPKLQQLRSDPSLLAAAAKLIRKLPVVQAQPLGLGERPPRKLDPLAVLERLPASTEALNEAYERTFGLLVSGPCPPHETDYIDSKHAFQRSNALADVNGFYRAFGLTTSQLRPERPDHAALELEFHAFLLGHERRAAGELATEAQRERLQVCREAQRRFLSEHLAWWTPAFARLLERETAGGFYEPVARFLAALIPAERAWLDVPPPPRFLVPSAPERPEACETCQLAPCE
jgi:TorA maturation chaperone TorD